MSDSDSSEAEIWAMGVNSPLDDRGRLLIKKRGATIKKRLAEKRLMKRRRSKNVGTILSECPGIGAEIEDFVKQCGAGADAWRRTGTRLMAIARSRKRPHSDVSNNTRRTSIIEASPMALSCNCAVRGMKGEGLRLGIMD